MKNGKSRDEKQKNSKKGLTKPLFPSIITNVPFARVAELADALA